MLPRTSNIYKYIGTVVSSFGAQLLNVRVQGCSTFHGARPFRGGRVSGAPTPDSRDYGLDVRRRVGSRGFRALTHIKPCNKYVNLFSRYLAPPISSSAAYHCFMCRGTEGAREEKRMDPEQEHATVEYH